jgi:hypothetical protein
VKTLVRFAVPILLLLAIPAPQPGFAESIRFSQPLPPPQNAYDGSMPLQNASSARSKAASPDDVFWDSRFAPSGVGGSVLAIAISGSDVYVGGSFVTAGNVVVNGIAKWNGTNWSALGSGVSHVNPPSPYVVVYSIAVSGTDVYVGGNFDAAGGVAAKGIAKWNGSTWSAVGGGVSGGNPNPGTVYSLALDGTTLYVGGCFAQAGTTSANNIAKWDGSNWSALGSGMSGGTNPPYVRAVAANGGQVYVGGTFSTAGGVSTTGIAKWDGANWSPLGSGVGGSVNAISVEGSDVYVGGSFTSVGGISASAIAKWDGSTWSALGTGVTGSRYGSVSAIATNGGNVYVGGAFTVAGDVSANNIAKWDGASWSSLSGGVTFGVYSSPVVSAIAATSTDIYAGGTFVLAEGNPVSNIARWNGSHWSALSVLPANGVTGSIRTMSANGSDVYGGGNVATDSTGASGVAKWNGNNWSSVGSLLGSTAKASVFALTSSGSNFYVGGSFTTAGGVSANNIARWNGNSWLALGSGVESYVTAIAASGSDVYVGGDFAIAGGTSASRIARWNGTRWSPLGTGMGGYDSPTSVRAMAFSGSNLYVGGDFTTAGATSANRVAKWNGSEWFALGTGVDSPKASVHSIAADSSDVYVGGTFTSTGGIGVNNVARWNETTGTWSPLGSGVNGSVLSIAIRGSDVFVGGTFTTAGGASANNIAKWNGSSWSALGSGVDNRVYALAVSGDNLYVGGDFTVAGGKPSHHFAIWNKPANVLYHYFPLVGK